ncbi:hypothetical protein ACJX0J_039786, partial [Zea mays]
AQQLPNVRGFRCYKVEDPLLWTCCDYLPRGSSQLYEGKIDKPLNGVIKSCDIILKHTMFLNSHGKPLYIMILHLFMFQEIGDIGFGCLLRRDGGRSDTL